MTNRSVDVDRVQSARRIERDVETLADTEYTRSSEAIRRYAYTPEYRSTLDYFVGELESLGFVLRRDGISHSPEEDADAALGAEIMLKAIVAYVEDQENGEGSTGDIR